MQVYGGEKYSEGLFQSLKTIYATEGIREGLFRGVRFDLDQSAGGGGGRCVTR